MDGHQSNDRKFSFKSRLVRLGLALLGIAGFVAVGSVLENEAGIPFDTTYRVACAAACLLFIKKLRLDYPEETWPWASLWIALLVNVGIFFTPLVDRPSSRGELMLFALPDAVVVLVARIASYRVTDVHQRAARQTMILGLVVALVFCVGLFALTLAEPHTVHPSNGDR